MFEIINLKDRIIGTIRKHRITLSMFAIATIQMVIIIYLGSKAVDVGIAYFKIALAFIFGGILSMLLNSVIDRLNNKGKNLIYLLIPVFMLLVYLILGDLNSQEQVWKYFVLNASTLLLYLVIPYIFKDEDSDYYSYKLTTSLLLTMVIYNILTISILIILYSISALFEFNIPEHLFPNTMLFVLGIIMPTLFFTIVPNGKIKREAYPNFITRTLIYVVFPILSIYTVILYSYFIKILVGLKWPSNTLASLVIFYSLISIITLYFSKKMDNQNKWSNIFVSKYPYFLILPLLMMLVSFVLRISQYGFTEMRYFGVMIFVLGITSIYYIVKLNKLKYIPITLAVLLLISSFGPLSAMNVSRCSQENRLKNLLIDNNMLVNNQIIKNPNISNGAKEEIIDILNYFDLNHKLSYIKYLPDNFEINNIEEVFGFKY